MTSPYHFVAGAEDARVRLDQFLGAQFGGLSRMRLARLIAEGHCLVNGAVKDAGYKMSAGDAVSIDLPDLGPTAMTPEPIPLEIVFEDSCIAVVVKPAGMLVHPTLGVKSGTLANALSYHFNKELLVRCSPDREPLLDMIRPGIVHRLDRATSGLLVVAKTPGALSVLTKHLRKGKVSKRYLAVVRGKVIEGTGSIEAPIGRDPGRRPHWGVMESGRASKTSWRVLDRASDWTVLELEPITGRTNQLRIHCAYWGHPILGDDLYGHLQPEPREYEESQSAQPPSEPARSEPAQSESLQSRAPQIGAPQIGAPLPLQPGRLLLHACRLAFHHPETGVWSEFSAPPPADFEF